MKVYLISSNESEFKTTKAKFYSSLDQIVPHIINTIYQYNWQTLEYFIEYKPKIYVGEIDSNEAMKLVSKKEWKEAMDRYIENNPAEIAKIKLMEK